MPSPSATVTATRSAISTPNLASGNGTSDLREPCDDGNFAGGDCCRTTCEFEPAASACRDHGQVCISHTDDGARTCAHTSLPTSACPRRYAILQDPNSTTATGELFPGPSTRNLRIAAGHGPRTGVSHFPSLKEKTATNASAHENNRYAKQPLRPTIAMPSAP